MKQAGKIRRPYHAQALALISLCRFLARHYESLTDEEHTATNVEPFEEYVSNISEMHKLRSLKFTVLARKLFRRCKSQLPRNKRSEALTLMRQRMHTCSMHSPQPARGSATASNTSGCGFVLHVHRIQLTFYRNPQLASHWAHYERIFQQAVEKDKSRTVQLNELLSAVSHSLPNRCATPLTDFAHLQATVPNSRRYFRFRAGESSSP